MFQSLQQLPADYATELLCRSVVSGGRFIPGFAAPHSALHLLAGRWPRQLRHCIAHCRYGSDFAHSTLLLLSRTWQANYFCSLQHDGGGLTVAGLLLRSHTAGTLLVVPRQRELARTCSACMCTHKIIHMFIAVLFSR